MSSDYRRVPHSILTAQHIPDTGAGRGQGWRAAEAGEGRSSCPYKVGNPSRTRWMKGYWDFQQGKPLKVGSEAPMNQTPKGDR